MTVAKEVNRGCLSNGGRHTEVNPTSVAKLCLFSKASGTSVASSCPETRARSRILIADDHNLVAELCRKILEKEFEVVGLATNGHDLVRLASELKPDVIVLDVGMPLLNGLDAGKQIKRTLADAKIVYLTMYNDPELAREAIDSGASGYLLKTCAVAELVTAVRDALKGCVYVSLPLRNKLRILRQSNNVTEAARELTPRQREVLQLLAEGKVMKEVGSILNMTTRTVAFHKYRIMQIIGARNTAELVRYAVRNHLVSP